MNYEQRYVYCDPDTFPATRNTRINIKKLKWVAEFLDINLH